MTYEPKRRWSLDNFDSSTHTIAGDGLWEIGPHTEGNIWKKGDKRKWAENTSFSRVAELSHRHSSSHYKSSTIRRQIFDSHKSIRYFTIEHSSAIQIFSTLSRPDTKLPFKSSTHLVLGDEHTKTHFESELIQKSEFWLICNMEIIDPSLGMFSLLPAEVRTQIWKHFSPQLHIGRSRPRKPNYLSRDQDILLASRKIYAEVAAEVPSGYNDNTIVISVRPEYRYKSWIKARNTKGVQWDLEDLPNAISRGFCDLPWHNLNVQIWIWAPRKKDGAQILCLYKKVQTLVEILKGAKGYLSLWVVFGHTKDTSWFDDAQPQCSIENKAGLLRWGGEIPGAKWDYEFIFPLFLQIRNVEMARMYSTEILEGKRKNLIMSKTFMRVQMIMRKTIPYGSPAEPDLYHGKRIEEHLDLLFMMVERILDLLPSKTANMLRLDRFSSWYTDKLHGNSPYENKLKKLLLDDVEGHDTLKTMNHRYRIMRAHNPLSLAYRSAFPWTFDPTKHPDIDARGWNRDAWHCVYRRGIPPLNSKKTDKRYRKWSMEYDAPENGGEFVKLQRYFSFLIARSPALDSSDVMD